MKTWVSDLLPALRIWKQQKYYYIQCKSRATDFLSSRKPGNNRNIPQEKLRSNEMCSSGNLSNRSFSQWNLEAAGIFFKGETSGSNNRSFSCERTWKQQKYSSRRNFGSNRSFSSETWKQQEYSSRRESLEYKIFSWGPGNNSFNENKNKQKFLKGKPMETMRSFPQAKKPGSNRMIFFKGEKLGVTEKYS